ncbi:MAG TPA: GNAT family N-acetyltransferase [Noviherbaspirillum sp.]|jgi:GNAT superfamily N-acetyltransferase|uniref:GNAT family N-acetyltransferase n=1 Tax=Noviherbaspirillum sp. TaxID=1926288 RepID=UPI002F944514
MNTPSPSPGIRGANPADGPAIAGLLAALGYPGTAGHVATSIDRLLAHPDAGLLVAEEQGAVIGFVSLHFIPQIAMEGDFCRISYFCVAEAARGRGIGAKLEEAVVALASGRGCDRIELHSHARREQAHRFYARQGYEESPKYLMKRLQPAP